MNRIRPATWAQVMLLLGEAFWLGLVLRAILAPTADVGVSVGLVFAGLLGGFVAASQLPRVLADPFDRLLVGALGITYAVLLSGVLANGIEVRLITLDAFGMALAGLGLWIRGVLVANGGRVSPTQLSISFAIGFGVMLLMLLFGLAGPQGALLALGYVATGFAAQAMITLDHGSERAGGRVGTEWLGVLAAGIAVAIGALLLFLGTVGRLLQEPLRAVLVAIANVILFVIVEVMTVVALFLNELTKLLVDAFGERFRLVPELDRVPRITQDAEEFDPVAWFVGLPEWIQFVAQLIGILVVVAILIGIIALVVRTRGRSGPAFTEGGVRTSLERPPVASTLFGWFSRPSAPKPKPVIDPLAGMGSQGRWLRARWGDLQRWRPAATTPARMTGALDASPTTAPLAPVSQAFQEARYGLRVPDDAEMRALEETWSRNREALG